MKKVIVPAALFPGIAVSEKRRTLCPMKKLKGVKGELMSSSESSRSHLRTVIAVMVILALAIAVWGFFEYRDTWPRGEALGDALRPLIAKQNTDQSPVARAIIDNYREARTNASRWSGIYWGFTFLAAALSALAGLILKFETIVKNDGAKKDIAALFSVAAAVLITISTSGDFQRKWQANRIAAAELERIGYELLEKDTANPRTYFSSIAQILYNRHVAIVGSMEQRKPAPVPSKGALPKE